MASFRLEIITAERSLFDGDVDIVIAPGMTGELAVLKNHSPLLTLLQAGELRYQINGEESYLVVSGGYMEVTSDRVTVLADAAERVEELEELRAQEAVHRAQERIANRTEDIDLGRALRSLMRSQMRLKVLGKRRR